MTTIDNLMALADATADAAKVLALESGKLTLSIYDKRRAALRAALTEALAQPIKTLGCTSNCENCTYAHGSPAHAGHCYMFYDEPQGVCAKWKDANPNPTVLGCVQHDCAECKARAAQPAQTDRPATDEFYKFWESKPELSKQQALGQFYAAAQPAREAGAWAVDNSDAGKMLDISTHDPLAAPKMVWIPATAVQPTPHPAREPTSEKLADWILTWFGPDADEDHCKKAAAALLSLSQPAREPLVSCHCFDDTARRYCKDRERCTKIVAHGIGGDK